MMSLALVARCGGLHRGLRPLDVQSRSCPLAGLVEVHADGRVQGGGARTADHHRRRGAGRKIIIILVFVRAEANRFPPDSESPPSASSGPTSRLASIASGRVNSSGWEASVRSTSDPQLVHSEAESPREPPASSGSGGSVTPITGSSAKSFACLFSRRLRVLLENRAQCSQVAGNARAALACSSPKAANAGGVAIRSRHLVPAHAELCRMLPRALG